jgi:peptidoglycan/xylan/chitin deacetylase (PgdA/CDA1 family)
MTKSIANDPNSRGPGTASALRRPPLITAGRATAGLTTAGRTTAGLTAAGLAAAGLAAVGLAMAQAGPGITALGPVRRSLFPRLAGSGPADHVALTFDDGPDPASTPRFLETLAARRVHATFFLLGSMVARAPGLAAEIAAAGHETAVHGWDHRYLPLRGPLATRDDLRRAADVIADATGSVPRLFRPPYGVLSASALLTARDLGLTPLLWGTWGREWAPGATAESVYATLARNLAGGVTVLLHDSDCTSPPGSWQAGLGALPMLLDECDARRLRVGTAAEHGITGRPPRSGSSGPAGHRGPPHPPAAAAS